MPKITDFEPDALAELLASIGKADAKVFADVPVDVLESFFSEPLGSAHMNYPW